MVKELFDCLISIKGLVRFCDPIFKNLLGFRIRYVDHWNFTAFRIDGYFIVDECVVKARICSLVTCIGKIDFVRSCPINRTEAHRTRLTIGI